MSAGEPAGRDHGESVPVPPEQFEDGLQRERTALAWHRTALSLIVAGSLSIEHLGAPYFDLFRIPAYCALIAGGAVLWLAATDHRWRSGPSPISAQLRPRRAWGVGLVTLALNVSSLVIVVLRR